MNAQVHARSAPGHKLHNSLLALFAVAVVSAASLMVARPLPVLSPAALVAADAVIAEDVVIAEVAASEALVADIAVQATRDAIEISVQSPADGFDAEAAPTPKPRKHNRRSRQTLAMPYFSFAARS